MMTEIVTMGRNEPCPCKSGKKYKRCCGVSAAPKITPPKNANSPMASSAEMDRFKDMDPQVMMQFSQALQRLPKGQMQRLQALMQKAMSGKDIAQEAKEFEKTLPLDFQNLMFSMMPSLGAAMGNSSELALPELSSPGASTQNEVQMSEDEARALVAKAAKEGKISSEQAESLLEVESKSLSTDESSSPASTPNKFSKLWKNLAGKKGE